MKKNKNTSKIILAAIVAVLMAVISYSHFSNINSELAEKQKLIDMMQQTKGGANQNATYAYAVAKTDLKAGEIVSDDDVDFKQFETIDTNAFENRSDVVNKVLLQDITTGSVFTTSHIAKISKDDLTLKEGCRALTLPADSFQGKSQSMLPGTSVDIYSSIPGDSWILENIKILSFEGVKKTLAPGEKSNIEDATSITFQVTTDSISDFISNVSKGRLVLVARGAHDTKITHKKPLPSMSNFIPKSSPSLPNLPASVPITNLPGGSAGLPQPIQPVIQSPAVELIEANVKSKVTFDSKE